MSKTNEARLDGLFQNMLDDLSIDVKDDLKPSVHRLSERMRKRAEYNRPDLEQKALESFKVLNAKVADTVITLDPDLVSNARYFISVIFERFNATIDDNNIQEQLDMSYLFSLWRFGPGASNGIKGTHCAEKISQVMTCTESATPLVAQLRASNPYFHAFDALHGNIGLSLYRGFKHKVTLCLIYG